MRRPLRADAQRNRDRLLTVARAAVAARGGEIVLEDIAREAGVGVGTLYRHFPTRQDLLAAVFIEETQELCARASELSEEPAALEALNDWLRMQLDYSARGRSMGAAVMSAKHVEGSEMQLASVAMRAAGEVLMRRAQAEGEVREGIELIDVLRLIYGIELANEHASEPDRAGKMFDLVIAGIRA